MHARNTYHLTMYKAASFGMSFFQPVMPYHRDSEPAPDPDSSPDPDPVQGFTGGPLQFLLNMII